MLYRHNEDDRARISKAVKASWNKKQEDLVGTKFGKLLVTGRSNRHGRTEWECLCDCGSSRTVRHTDLIVGRVTMCSFESKLKSDLRTRKTNGESSWNRHFKVYQSSANKREIDFKLSKQEFMSITSKDCYHCGAKPRLINYTKKKLDPDWGNIRANGIDRLDNNMGYTANNCVPCCKPCNNSKLDQTQEEFCSWIKRAYEHMKSEGRIQ